MKKSYRLLNRHVQTLYFLNGTHPDEALNYFIQSLAKLKSLDTAFINDLKIIFAPTGSLQELAISSGWCDKYLDLANEFDKLIDN